MARTTVLVLGTGWIVDIMQKAAKIAQWIFPITCDFHRKSSLKYLDFLEGRECLDNVCESICVVLRYYQMVRPYKGRMP